MLKNKIFKDLAILETLLTSACAEYSFDHLIDPIKRYHYLLRKEIRSRGALETLSKAKRVYHVCLFKLLEQPSPSYHLLSLDKSGWPKLAKGLRPKTSSPEELRLILTILSGYRACVVPGKPDLGSITDPGPNLSDELLQGISSLARKIDLPGNSVEYQFRSKSGPNGQAVRSAHLDALALKDCEINHDLRELLKLQDANSVVEDLDLVQQTTTANKRTFHSKLSYKYEAGGKVRVFAICDYYTQMTLLPLHQAVAERLSKLRQDFTWNQDGFESLYKSWKSKYNYFESIDLKSATDRFPATLQKRVVEKMVNSKFADHWYNLMTKRDFQSPEGEKRYSFGQPMGAYSSWPVFAYTHHLVVRYAAQLLKIRHPDYAIVGDDIVIPGYSLSKKYREIIQKLGVPISETKSIRGNSVEFCKRIWLNHREITPIPCKLLVECWKHPQSLIQLNKWAYERTVSKRFLDILLGIYFRRTNPTLVGQIILCITAPWKGWAYSGAHISDNVRWPDFSADTYEYISASFSLEKLEIDIGNMFRKIIDWYSYVDGKHKLNIDMAQPGISAETEKDYYPSRRVGEILPKLVGETISQVSKTWGTERELDVKARSYDIRILQPAFEPESSKVVLNLTPRIYSFCRHISPDTDLRDFSFRLPTRADLGASSLGRAPTERLRKRLLAKRSFWVRVWDVLMITHKKVKSVLCRVITPR